MSVPGLIFPGAAVAAKAPKIGWAPQALSHLAFLYHPAFEVLITGARGSSKTVLLLMAFLQHVGRGWGPAWRGIIFRQTYPQCDDIILKSKQWIPKMFPGAAFKSSPPPAWTFPDGEQLLIRYAAREADYYEYHGWEVPFLAFDELTNWPTPEPYLSLMTICRVPGTAPPGIPRLYRASSNAWGPGHGWVKERFITPAPIGVPMVTELEVDGQTQKLHRVRLRMLASENRAFMRSNPLYRATIAEGTSGSTAKAAAWLQDDWDIEAGGYFLGSWSGAVHVCRPFKLPPTWLLNRSLDWGQSKPYSVGWWAESDGSEFQWADGRKDKVPARTLFRIAELYGWNGEANTGTRETARAVARKIRETETNHSMLKGRQIAPGPADPSIYTVESTGQSAASEMEAEGVTWTRADASSGSRVRGAELMRARMLAAVVENDGRLERRHPIEEPALFIFDTCRDGFLRTVPILPTDPKNPDDVDTTTEDHAFDEARYRVAAAPPPAVRVSVLPGWG